MAGSIETLREGTWLYDGVVAVRVRIVRRDFDYYWEEGFHSGPPDLGPDGWAYYAEWESPATPGVFTSISRTCLSLAEAIALAIATTPGGVLWAEAPAGYP